jgi:hypothetical protein
VDVESCNLYNFSVLLIANVVMIVMVFVEVDDQWCAIFSMI